MIPRGVNLRIEYGSKRFEKQCDPKGASKKFGAEKAKMLQRRREQMTFAPTLKDFKDVHVHCEALTGDMAGEWSVRLTANWRLVFELADEPLPRKEDGGIEITQVEAVRLLRVEDYH